ncbi:MAG: hypothetical protein K2X99_12515, partial [Gemmatimonadaceae bacterium]|nr:hypothetical protein [Gemmatimonadaceae bacterium]
MRVPVGAIEGRWLAVRVQRVTGERAVGERVRWIVAGRALGVDDSASVVDEEGIAATFVTVSDTAATGSVTAAIGSASYRFAVRGTVGITLTAVTPASVA